MRLLILILFLMILRTSIGSLIQNLIYGLYEGQIQILNLSLPILLSLLVLLIWSPTAQPLFPRWIDVS
jgi:hypothetical protein